MTALIGIDWGSTNLRAFRFDSAGMVVETRRASRGAASMARAEFPAVVADITAGWRNADAPVVLAGMVGSRDGWREAPYLPCPADMNALSGAAIAIECEAGRCHLIPGLCARDAGGIGNVMRGEETQIAGAAIDAGRIVLPGTHSKWATIENGAVQGFATAMTGELFALLKRESAIGRLIPADESHDPEAFDRGAGRALGNAGLVSLLFSARADVLLGTLVETGVASYLSGLLIGGEIAEMTRGGRDPVTLIGDRDLCDLYTRALTLAGVEVTRHIAGDDAVTRGLWRLGEMLR